MSKLNPFKLPRFSGDEDDDVDAYLIDLERYFKSNNIPIEKQGYISNIASTLTYFAREWYHEVCYELKDFQEFKIRLKKRFTLDTKSTTSNNSNLIEENNNSTNYKNNEIEKNKFITNNESVNNDSNLDSFPTFYPRATVAATYPKFTATFSNTSNQERLDNLQKIKNSSNSTTTVTISNPYPLNVTQPIGQSIESQSTADFEQLNFSWLLDDDETKSKHNNNSNPLNLGSIISKNQPPQKAKEIMNLFSNKVDNISWLMFDKKQKEIEKLKNTKLTLSNTRNTENCEITTRCYQENVKNDNKTKNSARSNEQYNNKQTRMENSNRNDRQKILNQNRLQNKQDIPLNPLDFIQSYPVIPYMTNFQSRKNFFNYPTESQCMHSQRYDKRFNFSPFFQNSSSLTVHPPSHNNSYRF